MAAKLEKKFYCFVFLFYFYDEKNREIMTAIELNQEL